MVPRFARLAAACAALAFTGAAAGAETIVLPPEQLEPAVPTITLAALPLALGEAPVEPDAVTAAELAGAGVALTASSRPASAIPTS
jgi:hypothetical protein